MIDVGVRTRHAVLLVVLALLAASCASGDEPGKGRIAFAAASEGAGHNPNIFVTEGSAVSQLTDTAYYDGEPAWSPDGSGLAFVSTRDGNPEIYQMSEEGTSTTRLTDTPGTEGRPQWSPDGSRISFISDRDGDFDLFVMNADGTDPINLTNDPAFDGAATWSPDGLTLAFASNRAGNDFDIYLLNPDSNLLTRLTDDPMDEAGPAWSPDGSQIAFFAGSFETREYGLFVMDVNGSNRVRLADTNGHVGFIPAWSPDGVSIAYEHGPPGTNHHLFVVDVRTGTVEELLDRPGSWPAWSG